MSSNKKKVSGKRPEKKATKSPAQDKPFRLSTPTYTTEEIWVAQELYRTELTACSNDRDVNSVGLILKAICPHNCWDNFNLMNIPPNKNWNTRRIRPDARTAFFGAGAHCAANNDSGATFSLEHLIEDSTGDISVPTKQFLIGSKQLADQALEELRHANRRYLEAQHAALEAKTSKSKVSFKLKTLTQPN